MAKGFWLKFNVKSLIHGRDLANQVGHEKSTRTNTK